MVCRSVVTVGTVQINTTLSALRAALRSDGVFGKSSEGGSGGPMVAQAARRRQRQKIRIVQARPRMRIHRVPDRAVFKYWVVLSLSTIFANGENGQQEEGEASEKHAENPLPLGQFAGE